MRAFAQLMELLALTPSRNRKIEALTDYFRQDARPRPGFRACHPHRGADLSERQAGGAARRGAGRGRSVPLRAQLRLCRRPRRDHRADLAASWRHRAAAVAFRPGRAVQHDQQGGAAAADRLAADARLDQRALGAGEVRDRGAAHRHFGAAGEDGAGRDERQGFAGDRGGVERAGAALCRPVRMAERQGGAAGYRPHDALPSADAVEPDRRGEGSRKARSRATSSPSGSGTASGCSWCWARAGRRCSRAPATTSRRRSRTWSRMPSARRCSMASCWSAQDFEPAAFNDLQQRLNRKVAIPKQMNDVSGVHPGLRHAVRRARGYPARCPGRSGGSGSRPGSSGTRRRGSTSRR